ncbi:uncharacterized protein PAC_05849 [Phialocephala subalpina]|uniref:amidase n=1 Tax=Phialocephala subalpina TaxID=576137 RepID=A0A1L7WT80_9HELO|nr:uncharacterized protein PAC_05849 [Phialocephala subalpina]
MLANSSQEPPAKDADQSLTTIHDISTGPTTPPAMSTTSSHDQSPEVAETSQFESLRQSAVNRAMRTLKGIYEEFKLLKDAFQALITFTDFIENFLRHASLSNGSGSSTIEPTSCPPQLFIPTAQIIVTKFEAIQSSDKLAFDVVLYFIQRSMTSTDLGGLTLINKVLMSRLKEQHIMLYELHRTTKAAFDSSHEALTKIITKTKGCKDDEAALEKLLRAFDWAPGMLNKSISLLSSSLSCFASHVARLSNLVEDPSNKKEAKRLVYLGPYPMLYTLNDGIVKIPCIAAYLVHVEKVESKVKEEHKAKDETKDELEMFAYAWQLFAKWSVDEPKPLFSSALQRAKELDESLARNGRVVGPLHGLPISVKDSFDVIGVDSSIGIASLWFKPATDNSPLIDLLLSLGCIIIAKTNVPQTLSSLDSINNGFGRAMNPINRLYTAGGSSGGEGVIVAMRGSMVGWGADTGGSIRVPAMCNGIFGIKSSNGRVPTGGGPLISTNGISRCAVSAVSSKVDAVICVIGPHPVPEIERYNAAGYTSSWTLLDYPAGSVPVRPFSETDLDLGQPQGGTVISSWDERNRQLWDEKTVDRRVYVGTPLSVQVVTPKLQDKRLIEAMRIVDAAVHQKGSRVRL